MDDFPQYRIVYTRTAVQDIEEKADYISAQFRDQNLAATWYFRLRKEIQTDLSTFPLKYQCYDAEPWRERGVRLFVTRNDVVLYSVDQTAAVVYIRAVCTRGRDLSAHLEHQEQQ